MTLQTPLDKLKELADEAVVAVSCIPNNYSKQLEHLEKLYMIQDTVKEIRQELEPIAKELDQEIRQEWEERRKRLRE